MDRLLTWEDLRVHVGGTQNKTIPPELRERLDARTQGFAEDFDREALIGDPMHLLLFTAKTYDGKRWTVVIQRQDLHGDPMENGEHIRATAPFGCQVDVREGMF